MFGDPIFLPVAISSKNYRLQIPRPRVGCREGFHIGFLCKRSKQYVEFGI